MLCANTTLMSIRQLSIYGLLVSEWNLRLNPPWIPRCDYIYAVDGVKKK